MGKILEITKVFLQNFLKGKLTYISGGLLVLASIAGYATNTLSIDSATIMLTNGLGLLGLRRAVGNK